MHIRKLFLCVLFACSVAHSADTLSVTFARLDSLVKAINMLYQLYPDTTNLSSYSTPMMTWNGTKWVVSSGLTVTLGTASFDHFATRRAVYISGASASDYCFVVGIGDGSTLPLAADILQVYMKTDSLIVTRLASGTESLSFDYMRVK